MIQENVAISFGKFLLTKFNVTTDAEPNWSELFEAHKRELAREYAEKVKGLIPSIDDINFVTSRYFGVDPEEVKMSKTRRRIILGPRQVAHYISRILLRHRLQKIADYYHGINHASIINSTRTVKNLYDTDDNYKHNVDKLIEIITTRSNYGEEIKGISSKRES